MKTRERIFNYLQLMRLDKPIGIFLLMWPTLWALWLATDGQPSFKILSIFILGVILMRSAGCVVNDFTDRHLDAHVERTKQRPLVTGLVKPKEAILLILFLLTCSFILVLQCNRLTVELAFIGLGLTIVYPLMKRFTHLPQLGIGAAFSWGVPMVFAASTGVVTLKAWFLFLTCLVWPLSYDTMYAMADRKDDIKIGIKSTAILLNNNDRFVVSLLQLLFIILSIIIGLMFQLHTVYYVSLFLASLLFIYQQWLIKDRDPKNCFAAFLNNNFVGFAIFIGTLLSYSQ